MSLKVSNDRSFAGLGSNSSMIVKTILTPGARTCITLGACALLGGGVLLHSSRWGLGLSPDSVVYIGAARSLLAGYGFTLPAESALFSPITHYPPLYSSLLAVTGSVAADPLDGAIWLNVAALSVNIYVSEFLLFATFGSWRLALLSSLFTFTALPALCFRSVISEETSSSTCGKATFSLC